MSNYQEIQSDGLLLANTASACTIPEQKTIFVLPRAVVTVEMCAGRYKYVVDEKVVQLWNYSIWCIWDEMASIDKEVYSSQQTPNGPTFLGTKKYMGPGSKGLLGRWTWWA